MPLIRYGHAPGHVRDTALSAFEAWLAWDGTDPEPTVEYEVNYQPCEVSISQACGLVWNCSDVVPRDVVDQLVDAELDLRRRTYAGCTRAILASIKGR